MLRIPLVAFRDRYEGPHIGQREACEVEPGFLGMLFAVLHQPGPDRVPAAAGVDLAMDIAEDVDAARPVQLDSLITPHAIALPIVTTLELE
jgi:hypothetical protein